MTNVRWADLPFFLELARRRSLTAAARALGTNHATVGRRLKVLETAAGGQLFERTPAGYVPTERGEMMMQAVAGMDQLFQNGLAQLDQPDTGLSGKVRVGVLEGFGNFFLSRRIGGFAASQPSLAVEMVTIEQIVSLSKLEGDIGISLSVPARGRFVVDRLTDYRLRLYAAPEYLRRARPVRGVEDLLLHDVVGYVDDLILTRELDYLNEIHPRLRARIRCSSLTTQLEITALGHGICVLPDYIAATRPDLVVILPETVHLTRSYWMFSHEEIALTPRVRACRGFIKEVVAAAPPTFWVSDS